MSHPEPSRTDLAGLRLDYSSATLDESGAAPGPWEQFDRWFAEALAAPEIVEANAMVLATVSAAGAPSARTVLLKGIDPEAAGERRGFLFFTNHDSRKGHDLAIEPRCALLFEWHPMQRQVRVQGVAERLAADEVAAYFGSRPRPARLGAWASQQSSPVASRADLEAAHARATERFGADESDGEVPVPPTWGGYRVVPSSFEFWQGRPSRLHDRLEYLRDAASSGAWSRRRLAP